MKKLLDKEQLFAALKACKSSDELACIITLIKEGFYDVEILVPSTKLKSSSLDRNELAKDFMIGMLANSSRGGSPVVSCETAFEYADEFIKQAQEKKP